MPPSRYVAGAGLALALAASAAGAQHAGEIIVTPYAGLYAPSTTVAKYSVATGTVGATVSARHRTGLAVGANASYWIAGRVGVELGGGYAWSDLKGSGAAWGAGSDVATAGVDHAYVLLASARVMTNLLPSTSRANLRLGVGPAVIRRGGSAYRSDAETKISGLTDVGGAVSLCSRLGITHDVGVRLRAESYVYDAQLKLQDRTHPAGSLPLGSRFQTDYVLSVGLQIGVGR